MAVYFVTGKLGAGKSLVSVGRIRDKLNKGLPVATNLDINLKNMLGRNKKNTRLYRVPDKPEIFDLEAIGVGNKSYDESLNGLLVLDECGTWFNSRTWADKGRQAVINWLLHARKKGWDIIFIIQDLSLVDKQARLALAEHVVYCRRTDRATLPFIGSIFKILTGGKIPLPKVHLGIVRYGDSPTALKVDTWVTVGVSLYSSYDTKQMFTDHYANGVYSVLPPYYTHGRYSVPKTLRNIMRITKIYFRKWSRLTFFALGMISCFALLEITSEKEEKPITETVMVEPTKPLREQFSGWSISGFANFPGQLSNYQFIDTDGKKQTAELLRKKGFTVKSRGDCEALITKGDDYVSVYCN
ncbi:assembly protein [Marinomonas piezotolerans]|uniref:Assembly protein n=1 Tax=Marinomonas piezotolerans TaxID=2213058 RepID=A0A370U4B7_9GAMM|nr:assembly protein [Marinomonas piezotolerans]